MTRRVLVTGPRDYADREFVWSTLDALHAEEPIGCMIHGDAAGADRHARDWARFNGIEDKAFPADWDRIDGLHRQDLHIKVNRRGKPYNALAGFARNSDMLQKGCPTHVIGFPCPKSWRGTPGTSDMLGKARFAKTRGVELDVLVYHHPSSPMMKDLPCP